LRAYIRIVSAVSRAAGLLAAALLGAAVVVVCQMIVVRYFMNASTIWQTEFVIYSLVAATFLGSAYVLIRKGHVGVDLMPNAMGRRGSQVMKVVAATLSIVFLGILTWSGWGYFHEAWAGGWTTDTVWALPLWIPLLPFPVGMGLLILQYIAEIMKVLLGEDDNLPDGAHDLETMEGMAD